MVVAQLADVVQLVGSVKRGVAPQSRSSPHQGRWWRQSCFKATNVLPATQQFQAI
jgi:hypothetical protein